MRYISPEGELVNYISISELDVHKFATDHTPRGHCKRSISTGISMKRSFNLKRPKAMHPHMINIGII
jgi:hypothetical protein